MKIGLAVYAVFLLLGFAAVGIVLHVYDEPWTWVYVVYVALACSIPAAAIYGFVRESNKK
ncbi:MAG: hypothetical protein PVI21_03110 [Candidatus Woesebacteria bacterium]|jgi:hypothetical protein